MAQLTGEQRKAMIVAALRKLDPHALDMKIGDRTLEQECRFAIESTIADDYSPGAVPELLLRMAMAATEELERQLPGGKFDFREYLSRS